MTTYSKLNIIYRLQKWLDSVPGQTFMNYAYSWGASIVILGTLFKLTHLPGANLMLFIGMGTEVFVFFIAAFDRPFDKTADGMDLPTHVVVGGGIIGGVVQQPEVPEIDAEEMEEATAGYVEQLKKLTETLQKVSDQSERLTRDSEEMENLNRTLTGICKVYEMQLKGASQQIGTIDQINEQSKRMAEQIAELNKIYTRMIEAMTVNMPKVVKSEE